ncbi:ATP-binding cassette domain-containing protein [Bacillaceae bacterium]
MIKISNLYKTYTLGKRQVEALKNINLEVKKGEIFGVIGFSGAGKSSLIRCINMLERPTSGSVLVNGQEMTALRGKELRLARRKIGMIFQHFHLLSSATVFENVAAPLRLAKKPQREIAEKVNGLLQLVGLAEKRNAYPSQLSGGQKQRVAIARALASDPEILLCDEATSALDPQTTDAILDLLLDINRRFGLTILLITHEMHVIKKICDRVAVLEAGEIIEQGSVLEVFANPQTETTKNFIRNLFDDQLPPAVRQAFQKNGRQGKLVRLSFVGETAAQPVLAELAVRFPLTFSILYGNITQVKETTFGRLVVHLHGADEAVAGALRYLNEKGVRTEVIPDVD